LQGNKLLVVPRNGANMTRTLAKNPVALVERGAPHRIHDDEELARYTQALFRLTAKQEPTDAEQETIDLLTLLIEDYESRYRIPEATPVEVLKYLVEKAGLRQQDLRPELGSLSNISMIFSGRRNLTLRNASALAGRFNLDIRAFLPAPVRSGLHAKAGRTKSGKRTTTAAKVRAPRRPAAHSVKAG
jgi:HTH-type transcriptional regulator/antitoxin HigA